MTGAVGLHAGQHQAWCLMHACMQTTPCTCRLHQLLSDVVRGQKQPGYTVIHTGRNSWAFAFYSAAGVGLVYAYCRCVAVKLG